MTDSLADRITAGDMDALDDIEEWGSLTNEEIRAIVARVRTLTEDRNAAIEEGRNWADQSERRWESIMTLDEALDAAEQRAATAEAWIESAVCGTCGEPVARTEGK